MPAVTVITALIAAQRAERRNRDRLPR